MRVPRSVLREVELRRVRPDELAGWQRLLDEPPLFAEPLARPEPLAWGLALGAGLLLFGLAFAQYRSWNDAPDLLLRAGLGASGLALSALAAMRLVRARRVARSVLSLGRFLYAWGYVEVHHDRLLFVPGTEIVHRASIGPPRVSGASRIAIHLAAGGGWRTVFRLLGSELDVPTELGALRSPRFDRPGGYRAPAAVDPTGRARRWRVEGSVPVGVAVAAAVGALLPIAARIDHDVSAADEAYDRYARWTEVEALYPIPWVRDRAARARAEIRAAWRARIEREIRSPYREPMVALLDEGDPSIGTFERCALGSDAVEPVARFARELSSGRPVATLPVGTYVRPNPSLDAYFDYARPWHRSRPRVAHFESSCELEPVRLLDVAPVRAAFRMRASWRLEVRGREVARRATAIEPETIAAVARCADPDLGPAAAELQAAATLFGVVEHRDVYAGGSEHRRTRALLDGLEELEPCVDSVASQLVVRDELAARRRASP